MTHKEAKELSMKSRWKTTPCGQEKCWCLMIEPETPIKYDEVEEYYIAGSGCIAKEEAEHIVKLHNQALQSESERMYEIEFDRGLKTVIQVTDSGIKIISAVDGWGCNIEDEFITIQSLPKTPKI